MHEVSVDIRWRDMDAYGHVNNATYLTYLEECRDAWVQRVLGPVSDPWNFVLAHVDIDFQAELTQDDGRITVRCRIDRVGSSSIRTAEEILKLDGTTSAEARSVIVPRDPKAGRSRPLTDPEREALRAELERDAAAGTR
jgi:acyl-CoA thioester hydrolase